MQADTHTAEFRVRVEPRGLSFRAQADEALLAAALRHGIAMPHSCGHGGCGSCKILCREGEALHGSHDPAALTPEERAAGYLLACRARAQSDLVLESERIGADPVFPMRREPARVLALTALARDVMEIRLQHAGAPLAFHAGQHLRVALRDGTVRSYSIANAPVTAAGAARELELHVRLVPQGTFSGHVFGAMRAREMLRIEGPLGDFRLREASTAPVILLASGTGFAPIKAMIEHIRFRDIRRPFTLYWGGRRPHDLYLHHWMLAQLETLPQLRYVPVLSDALPSDGWRGRTGWAHRAVLEDHPDLAGFEVYACGSPQMVKAAREDCTRLAGLEAHAFHADAFIPATPPNS